MSDTIKLDSIFQIEYGNHEINSKSDLEPGSTLVISSQERDGGCYGFFNVKPRYTKPVISVPRTGSIGEAFVQMYPCDIDDNCLVLIPKNDLPLDYLFYVACIIRDEKWRYMYGRQITPTRIGKVLVKDPKSFVYNISYNKMIKRLCSNLTTM